METAENLCLGFGCQGEKEFCKGLWQSSYSLFDHSMVPL